MPASVGTHSHRSTTKTSHKPFKSKKATKGALKEISKGRNKVHDFFGAYLTIFQARLKMDPLQENLLISR
jgi:hypothetical protein